jgi:hypothetical protein
MSISKGNRDIKCHDTESHSESHKTDFQCKTTYKPSCGPLCILLTGGMINSDAIIAEVLPKIFTLGDNFNDKLFSELKYSLIPHT